MRSCSGFVAGFPEGDGVSESCASSSAIWPWWLGGVGGEAPASVAAVAAWWVDHLQLLEVEFGNRLQLLGQPRSFKIGRESVQPGAVFVLQIDECGNRRRPPSRPRQDAPHRR